MGKVLGYARVSTSDHAAAGQRDRMAAVGRPELARLIEQARSGDSLYVTRLDRLRRSLKEMLETFEDLKSRGMYLFSFEEQIDTSSVTGELVFHVFGAITHLERRLISERTREGIAAALRSGRPASWSLRPAA